MFTGTLQVPRREAADRAAMAGADVTPDPGVTRKMTMLVVGDQDNAKLNATTRAASI